MNRNRIMAIGIMTGVLSVAAVEAHDPSKHSAMEEKPDCSFMKDGQSEMVASDDPVQQAMMMKCDHTSTEHMDDSGHEDMGQHSETEDGHDAKTSDHEEHVTR